MRVGSLSQVDTGKAYSGSAIGAKVYSALNDVEMVLGKLEVIEMGPDVGRAPNNADMRGLTQDAVDGGLLLADNNNSQVGSVIARQQAIQAKRNAVNATAKELAGAAGFSKDERFSAQYPAGSWKCSAFVGYVLDQVGLRSGSGVVGRAEPGYFNAGEWMNPNNRVLNGRRLLTAGETPQPGDMFGWKFSGGVVGATGHMGIVVDNGRGGIEYMAAHETGVYVDPNQLQEAKGTTVQYRRYVGGELP